MQEAVNSVPINFTSLFQKKSVDKILVLMAKYYIDRCMKQLSRNAMGRNEKRKTGQTVFKGNGHSGPPVGCHYPP